jgi:hypothetical protein
MRRTAGGLWVPGPLFAVVDQGGGGGRAGSLTENDSYALDKPYDLNGAPTAEALAQIDEMFSILFKGLTRARTGISGAGAGDVRGPSSSTSGDLAQFADGTGKVISDSGVVAANVVSGPTSVTDGAAVVFDGTTGKLIKQGSASPVQTKVVTITDAEMKALNTTPKQLLTAPGANQIILVTQMWATVNVTTNGGVTVNGTVRYDTALQAIVAAHNMVVNAVNGRRTTRNVMVELVGGDTSDHSNNGVEIIGSANAGATYASVDGYHIYMEYFVVSAVG